MCQVSKPLQYEANFDIIKEMESNRTAGDLNTSLSTMNTTIEKKKYRASMIQTN